VKPPSISECPQIAECTVDEIVKLEKSSGIVIANIVALVFDEGLEEMDRGERIRAMNLPVGLGDQNRMEYWFSRTGAPEPYTLKETPQGYAAANLKADLTWEEPAMQELMKIPPFVRKMVMKQVEKHALKAGAARVTVDHMTATAAEFGMDEAMLARFRGRNSG